MPRALNRPSGCGLVALLAACSPSQANEPRDAVPKASAAPVREDPLATLEARAFPLLVWSAHLVQNDYFDKSRFDPLQQTLTALQAIGLHTPEFFAEPNADETAVNIKVLSATARFELSGLDTLDDVADLLEQILQFVQQQLQLPPEQLHELEYAAINGALASLDPHTVLLTPEEHADLGVRTKGQFGGIGAQIRAGGRRIIIVRTLPGMPAELAGMEAGDVLLQIGEQSTINMTAEEAQQVLRGPVGSTIAVKVRRGSKHLGLSIKRDVIRIDSVQAHALPDSVALLQISTFQENTGEQVSQALTRFEQEHGQPSAVVVDLRGNGGGLLTQATAVVDAFVAAGELVLVRSASGVETERADAEQLVDARVPIVALIDEQSASAAEIVAGSLQALGRATVLGRSTFGKGTVQMLRPAAPYGQELALKLTVAEYRVAGDRQIQTNGVVPDIELVPVDLTTIPGIVRYYDDERFERQRERSRTRGLPSRKHTSVEPQAPPKARIRYLRIPDRLPTEAEPTIESMADAEIRLSHALALAMRPSASAGAIEHAAQAIREAEDDRIVRALRRTKVDWSAGPSADKVTLSAKLAKLGPIAAGEPFVLRFEVGNPSDRPVHRIHAITDSEHDELDGIEVLVGTIAPGEIAVRDVLLHVMPWHTDFVDELHVEAFAGEPGQPIARTSVLFEVAGTTAPHLAFDYWIIDDPRFSRDGNKAVNRERQGEDTKFTVTGNGDGLLQPAEAVLLAVRATNTGRGAAEGVRAFLRNLSREQGMLEQGVVDLGALEPGASSLGWFGISINEQADPQLPFELDLVVGDPTHRVQAREKLGFRVFATSSSASDEPRLFALEPGTSIRLYAGAHASAPIVVEFGGSPTTTLATTKKVGDWYAMLRPDRMGHLFFPADLEGLIPRGKATSKDKTATVWQQESMPTVLPPVVEVGDYPRSTPRDRVSLTGTVSHVRRVRDVAILVRPAGPGQWSKKVHYTAAPQKGGELRFAAEVPLQPGGNVIEIVARDAAKIEAHRELWIFREPEPVQRPSEPERGTEPQPEREPRRADDPREPPG